MIRAVAMARLLRVAARSAGRGIALMEDQSGKAPTGPGSGRAGHPTQEFEVRVTGGVPDEVLEELAQVDVTLQELRTSLRGRFRDQAELHGFLVKLRAFGLEVVEVRRLSAGITDDPEAGGP
jgi:hypothetical protein